MDVFLWVGIMFLAMLFVNTGKSKISLAEAEAAEGQKKVLLLYYFYSQMTTQIKNSKKTVLAVEFGRSMLELRTYTRQQIQLKIKEHGINITFEMLEVMGCLWR